MLKKWLSLTLATTLLSLLLPSSAQDAQDTPDSILFLHLRRDPNGISLLRTESRPGQLKPQSRGGVLSFEVSSPDQPTIHTGHLDDPLSQVIEYPDASDSGQLRTELLTRDSAEFTLRLPGKSAGRTLKFFRRAALENGRLKTLASPELIGEIAIPEAPDRLQSFATSARLYTLLTNGPTSARLNIAILAEGFTETQESTFTNRARTLLNQFLAVSPYKEYRNHFNGFAIFVPSVQSGSDHPTTSTYRNTYFNSSYGTGGLVRLITIPPNNFNSSYSAGVGKVNSLLQQFLPEYDIALLLVNDSEYGGSGGFPAIGSIHTSSSELALHEIAHSFADLADEYDSAAPGYPQIEKANTTRETRREFIKWRAWINDSTPIPTPETSTYGNVVGLFEGAYFHETDWYRPKLNCRMNTLGVEFCEVCKETIILSAYTRLPVIHGSSPVQNNVTVPGGGEIVLQVDTVNPVQSSLNYTWTIDGVTNTAFTSNTFPASFATLGLGTRLVRVSVNDPTKFVRNDTLGTLRRTRSWLIQVPSETNQPPVLSSIPDQIIQEAGALSVNFTLTDPDTPLDTLQLSIASSHTNIISDSEIHLTGAGTNRSLNILSHCDGIGVTAITLTATDGANTVSAKFELIVERDQDPIDLEPIPDQKTFSGVLTIPFRLSYPPCASNLTFSFSSSDADLLPVPNISVVGTGTNRTLRLEPAPGRSGSSLVGITASHGINVSSTSFSATFLKAPVALAAPPQITPAGIYLQFSSDTESAMVLEFSADFRFWTPVTSTGPATSLDHLIPKAALSSAGFYRLRLLPL